MGVTRYDHRKSLQGCDDFTETVNEEEMDLQRQGKIQLTMGGGSFVKIRAGEIPKIFFGKRRKSDYCLDDIGSVNVVVVWIFLVPRLYGDEKGSHLFEVDPVPFETVVLRKSSTHPANSKYANHLP